MISIQLSEMNGSLKVNIVAITELNYVVDSYYLQMDIKKMSYNQIEKGFSKSLKLKSIIQ